MDEEKIGIKTVKVEYISTKTDKYDNEIIYFKLKDKVDLKFANLMKPSYILPWFKSDKGHYLLKVKTKYCKMKELKKEDNVLVDVIFKYYKMNDIQGYYVSSIA
jgi:hypothetical protein